MSKKSPPLAYLVSAYPAISHTFILREVKRLRELGHDIVTASLNQPDRPIDAMDPFERGEAEATYFVKADGISGALTALIYWFVQSPLRLMAMLRLSRGLGRGSSSLRGLAYGIEAAMVARWLIGRERAHLHVHFGNVGATVGVLVKRLTGCHLSFTIHGPDEFDDVPGQHLALKMQEADVIICISQFARGQLMRICHPDHWPKFQVCRLGVDPDQFDFSLHPPGPLTQLLCVGRLTPAKGQVLLVQACQRLRDLGLSFHLTMVGAGPDRERIEKAISVANLGTHITLTGALTQDGVRAHLAQADIFVLPSLAEGIPVVLMEAMSSGVPCLSTPVNGIPELIQHERTGLMAIPGDVDSLTEQLRRLIVEPELRPVLALAAREKIRVDFNLPRNVEALSAIFCRFSYSRTS